MSSAAGWIFIIATGVLGLIALVALVRIVVSLSRAGRDDDPTPLTTDIDEEKEQ